MNFKKINKLIFTITITLIGFIIGYLTISAIHNNGLLKIRNNYLILGIKIFTSLIFALIFYSFSGRIGKILSSAIKQIEFELSKKPLHEVVFASIGLVIGLLIAFLLSQMITSFNLGFFGSLISLVIYVFFGYLGLSLSIRNKETLLAILKDNSTSKVIRKGREEAEVFSKVSDKKILDTSAIIDGRILEIAKSGFLEGPLILPIFILEELQHIADSSDSLKRNRGRRGLEVMNGIQALDSIELVIVENKYEEINEVDSKLIKLAKEERAKIITNDFNLNKVAEVQGIGVLNINELANALKPIAIPGETMIVQIIKEGQEVNQGVAYLDDGTMIVIENGKAHIGEVKEVLVTSVLQTNAGKMIFAKIK